MNLNGVPLNNPATGWLILKSSVLAGGRSIARAQIKVPGMPGYIAGPSTPGALRHKVIMWTPKAHLDDLLALLEAGTVLSDDGDRVADVAIISLSDPERDVDRRGYQVQAVYDIPSGVWRDDAAIVTGPAAIANPVQEMTLLSGISASVFDADVFLSGVFGQFELLDVPSQTWVRTVKPWVGTGTSGILFVGATGQAFRANTSSPWVPVSDAGDFVDQSGGGGFRITPEMVGLDPTSRRGRLRLTTLSQTSVTLRVRARGAYLIRAGAL